MGKKKAAKGGADAGDASGGGDGAEAARAAAAATPSAAASGADVVPPTDANGDPEQADDERDTRKGEDAKQAAGLSRMTDYVETRELDSAKAARVRPPSAPPELRIHQDARHTPRRAELTAAFPASLAGDAIDLLGGEVDTGPRG